MLKKLMSNKIKVFRKINYTFISFCLLLFNISNSKIIAEEPLKISKSSQFVIEEFSPKDISKDIYKIKIKVKKSTDFVEALDGTKSKKYTFEIGTTKAIYILDSAKTNPQDQNSVEFLIKTKQKIDSGLKIFNIYSYKNEDQITLEATKQIEVPNRNSSPGKQPFIQILNPEAGKSSDTITIIGENFGNDLDSISVSFGEINEKEEEGIIDVAERKPFYLSPILNGSTQELKFNMPSTKIIPGTFLFKQNLYLRIFVNGRPSDYKKLVILSDYWKLWMLSFTIALISLFHLFIIKVLKKKNYLSLLLIDKSTNTYSLSRFQAFSWTVLLLGGYFYITISSGVLLGNGIIPEFNPSLIGLLSISYGGLITAHSLGSKKPKNEILKTPPLLNNLFSSGESIDLPRLQLFSFTVVGIIIYMYNLLNSNPLAGLPDIPSSFLGLLGVSQTGYITGKFVSDKIVINQIKPYYIAVNQKDVRLHILGAGFVQNMKILIDDINEPINVDFINSNAISFLMPERSNPGFVSINILHNDFAPILTENCLEIISFEPTKIPSFDNTSLVVSAGKIPPGTELLLQKEEEVYRLRGNLLPDGKIDFKSPNLPPGNYSVTIHFKNENNFEKIKINSGLEVYTTGISPATVSSQTLIKEEDINDEDELDLPDKTEMPWYQSGFTEEDDEDDNTQVAIELDDQMEAELNVSEIARA
jgi:hypothetical protein